jgi:hypothetical protein
MSRQIWRRRAVVLAIWLAPISPLMMRAATVRPANSVEALDEATAIEKAAAEFKVPANRLMAIRR